MQLLSGRFANVLGDQRLKGYGMRVGFCMATSRNRTLFPVIMFVTIPVSETTYDVLAVNIATEGGILLNYL